MSEEKSPDWLPAGWTVDRKVRKNGRKDMCYIDPSNKLKFYSKPEVLRYLNKERENSCQQTNGRNGTLKHVEDNVCYHKRKSTSENVENNVLVEKTVPKELPPGWTKEVKETKRGRTIRKDMSSTCPYIASIHRLSRNGIWSGFPEIYNNLASARRARNRYLNRQEGDDLAFLLLRFFTDPVTGYIFRSLKDVNRYLKTGDVGKHAFKPKDDTQNDMELNDEKLTTHSPAEREKSIDEGTNVDSTDSADVVCFSENASEPCKENVAVGNVNIPEDIELDAEAEEKTENELKKRKATQSKGKKSKEESTPNLPRRASKRLAGVEVDLPREPKTRRQVSATRASEVKTRSVCLASSADSEMRCITDSSYNEKQANSAVLPQVKSFPNLGNHSEEVEMDTKPKERRDGNAEADKETNEKQQSPLILTHGIHTTSKDHGCNLGTDDKSCVNREAAEVNISTTSKEQGPAKLVMDNIPDEKLEKPLPASAEEDGKKVEPDNNNYYFAKQKLSNGVSPLADFLIPGEYPGNMVTDNKAEIKSESPSNLSLSNIWEDPCIEFAVKTLTGDIPVCEENKVDTYSGPLEMPLGGLWADPCIEFAVKTLTGEDLNVQQYFQHSSENHVENGPALPDVLHNISQTEFLPQHFSTQQNSVNKQPECVLPMLPNHRNGSQQQRQQHGKGNNGECSRNTFF